MSRLIAARAPAKIRKNRVLTTASLIALAAALPAQAQTQTAQTEAVDEIVVTGTRVVRDGYQAPTPLTVMDAEQIRAAAPANVADFVNELPALAGSVEPQNSNASISSGTAGINALNLRALGTDRTLVLMDGQRSVPSTITGSVDVNNFPQQLVSRVDVVTGGASAAYGSDALSGVVNFVLDKEFTGLSVEADGGITTYGDDLSWKLGIAYGTPFAGGRGHFLLSGEYANKEGIFGVPRAWAEQGIYLINNPAYGTGAGQSTGVPERIIVSGAGISNATYGGIITNTALSGIAFNRDGSPYQFQYGPQRLDPWTVGGQAMSNQANTFNTLDPSDTRQGVFTRVSYDLADYAEVFVQGSWNYSDSEALSGHQYHLGNLLIRADNAFLPQSVRDLAAARGVTQFNVGKFNGDIPIRGTDNDRITRRVVAGANGSFSAVDADWSWDAYYQYGETRSSENLPAITNNARYARAIDAVRAPNGTIVCRVNADATTTNDDPQCVPFNIFGEGVVTEAAKQYVLGRPHRNQKFTQHVAAVSFSGEPFSLWAGPVSLAFGAEHRKEAVAGAVPQEYVTGWFVGNYRASFGSYTVTEGFVETVVPLANGESWAESLDLNAAVRATDYSTSGFVTTWKVGATYAPMSDIRFRVTRSRDIRAPNLSELFQAGGANTNNIVDPFTNPPTVVQYQGLVSGNPDLQPEKADTWGLGVVVSPGFVPGFTASFDYFNINIKDAIGNVGNQTIVDRCFAGDTAYCAAITRGPNASGVVVITQIRSQPFNLVSQQNRGFDVDLSYRTSLDEIVDGWAGNLSLRALATRYLENYRNDGIAPPTESVGQNSGNGPPKWRYRLSAGYNLDPVGIILTARGISAGVYDNTNIECQAGCPVSTATNRTVGENDIEGAWYFDLNLTYQFLAGDDGDEGEAFLTIKNVLNTDPAVVAQGPAGTSFLSQPANPTLYDTLGRTFRAGVRFRM
ncbi:MAG: TonB-dependent receptor plug domain-containing protein [Rhodospirillaceae bacterium]